MLEKQMGPEPFRKILQRVILRAQDPVRHVRTLSTKEFRHFANKLGNLERPFLKEFFPRWVESSGCPRLRFKLVTFCKELAFFSLLLLIDRKKYWPTPLVWMISAMILKVNGH
jgi:hypothetical protein